MWQALAAYAVRGPAQAALVSFSTLVLALFLPPMVVISNAIIALVWLRSGPAQGAIAVAIALLAGTVMAAFYGNALVPATLMVSSWLPVIVIAVVLRQTVSLSLAILAGGVVALIAVLLTYMFVDSPSDAWQGMLNAVAEVTQQVSVEGADAKAGAEIGNEDRQRLLEVLSAAGSWITGFFASSQLVVAVISLLLARVWQARMFNPGGLQKEFHSLRFGQTAGLAGIVIVAAAVFLQMELLTNLAIVVITVFAFQGLAVIHALLARVNTRTAVLILVMVYCFLLWRQPISVQVVGLLGLADTWLDIRGRFSQIGKDQA